MEKAMILLIDNYDSFTYNLYHYLGELGAQVSVFLNDKITLEDRAPFPPRRGDGAGADIKRAVVRPIRSAATDAGSRGLPSGRKRHRVDSGNKFGIIS